MALLIRRQWTSTHTIAAIVCLTGLILLFQLTRSSNSDDNSTVDIEPLSADTPGTAAFRQRMDRYAAQLDDIRRRREEHEQQASSQPQKQRRKRRKGKKKRPAQPPPLPPQAGGAEESNPLDLEPPAPDDDDRQQQPPVKSPSTAVEEDDGGVEEDSASITQPVLIRPDSMPKKLLPAGKGVQLRMVVAQAQRDFPEYLPYLDLVRASHERRLPGTREWVAAEKVDSVYIENGKAPQSLKYLKDAAVIVLTYDRTTYLQRTLESLNKVRLVGDITVYVSEDGRGRRIGPLVQAANPNFQHLQRDHVRLPGAQETGTAFIAAHYKEALDRVFVQKKHTHAILLEDDMLFSPDLLQFFEQLAPLLAADPSLWCVSTWNDNGFNHLVEQNLARLRRTSFFPGLGWMLSREVWLEIRNSWSNDHWDHGMRIDSVHRGRQCVIPEISRNYNIGETGTNVNSAEYDRFLRNVAFADKPDVYLGDVSRMLFQEHERDLRKLLSMATVLETNFSNFQSLESRAPGVFLVPYAKPSFGGIAGALGLWNTPRAHHRYTQILYNLHGKHVLILASNTLSPYVPTYANDLEKALESIQVVRAERDQSCVNACSNIGLSCESSSFDYINHCHTLYEFFECGSQRGCFLEWGTEIPVYVPESRDRNYQRCLITEEVPQCTSQHPHTTRLCPCT